MGILQLNSHNLASFSASQNFKNTPHRTSEGFNNLSFPRRKIPAVETARQSEPEAAVSEEEQTEAGVNFAFVSSVLLPDGTPDVHYRTASGGQKLRDIMLDNNIELYGPYARPLLNCGGGGTCGTCLVEVVEGKEILTPRTDKEKEKLKGNPKNWRLACQITVGNEDSRGLVVIQQLPEWKGHDWVYGKEPPEDETSTI
ncbi:unnamed protein product [Fraxinus pennsylvanica]|uniref:2Fe-2S ferredoxin-type domain-containing protein n=1 Tax=Fraxinus pennsylvanica TaxID=56036 RepID=A0AAD2DU09_9LAMI|nr:unnamed protein product [Fraxinus pennsylvanica]